jgi:hypothetical protein
VPGDNTNPESRRMATWEKSVLENLA